MSNENPMNAMYKVWHIFDPRRALIALFGMLFVLAVLIHLILLGSKDFNWLSDAPAAAPATAQVSPIPVGRNIN
jgi:light-harvesting complex 1 alpha chain